MAHRRWLGALARSILSPQTLTLPKTLTLPSLAAVRDLHSSPPIPPLRFPSLDPLRSICARKLSHRPSDASSGEDDDDDDEDDDDDDEEYDGEEEGEDGADAGPLKRVVQSGKTEEEKVKEAEEIGYQVVGPLGASEQPFKPWKPVFAVVQIGSHQFKVSNGDSIFTERLKYCDVNDKLILKKVLILGSKSQTIIGRPILPDSAVHAVVEEHALDAKVIIFKKKRRKNYRRTKGHRQELTKLRITDIQGIGKAKNVAIAA